MKSLTRAEFCSLLAVLFLFSALFPSLFWTESLRTLPDESNLVMLPGWPVPTLLSREHEQLCFSFRCSLRVRGFLKLFDSVCVPQRVQRVLAAGERRRDVSDHDCLAVAHEAVLEHDRQLGLPEWRVLLVQVQGSDALFEGQEAFVDFGSVLSRLLVLVVGVGSALVSGQVDEGHFAVHPVLFIDDVELEDGVRPRRVEVRPCHSSHSVRAAVVDLLHQVLDRGDLELFQADDVDLRSPGRTFCFASSLASSFALLFSKS